MAETSSLKEVWCATTIHRVSLSSFILVTLRLLSSNNQVDGDSSVYWSTKMMLCGQDWGGCTHSLLSTFISFLPKKADSRFGFIQRLEALSFRKPVLCLVAVYPSWLDERKGAYRCNISPASERVLMYAMRCNMHVRNVISCGDECKSSPEKCIH